jgi:hypothetical protein
MIYFRATACPVCVDNEKIGRHLKFSLLEQFGADMRGSVAKPIGKAGGKPTGNRKYTRMRTMGLYCMANLFHGYGQAPNTGLSLIKQANCELGASLSP